MSQSQRQIFQRAAARWSQIIVGDLPDVTWNGVRADDLVITASTRNIDGVNGILGQAGPTHLRRGSALPSHGIMQFDSADMNHMENNGSLFGVILHEMGHVIGIGTIWNSLNLVRNVGQEIHFTGQTAAREYNRIFGTNGNFVPVETGGGSGTRGSHWSENVFDNELMTGWANGSMPISRVTVGALADMGYRVNLSAADAYSAPALRALSTSLSQSQQPALQSSTLSTASTTDETATLSSATMVVRSTAVNPTQRSLFSSSRQLKPNLLQHDDSMTTLTDNESDWSDDPLDSEAQDRIGPVIGAREDFPQQALDMMMAKVDFLLLDN